MVSIETVERGASSSASLYTEVLLQECNRAGPCVLRRREIRTLLDLVALCLRIILCAQEAVYRSLVVDAEIVLAERAHYRIDRRHRRTDARILRAVEQHHGLPDLRHRVRDGHGAVHVRECAIERDASGKSSAVVDRCRPSGRTAPAIADDGVSRRGGWLRHRIVRGRRDPLVSLGNADAGDELARGIAA